MIGDLVGCDLDVQCSILEVPGRPQSVPFEMRYGSRVGMLAQYGTGVASKLQPSVPSSLLFSCELLFHYNESRIDWSTAFREPFTIDCWTEDRSVVFFPVFFGSSMFMALKSTVLFIFYLDEENRLHRVKLCCSLYSKLSSLVIDSLM